MKYSFMRYSYGMLCILLFSGTVHPALGQFVFWIDANFSAPSIGRSDLGGGNAITMPLAPQSLPEGLALDATNNRVFFGELGWTNANVRRVDRDLTTLNSVIANGSAMRGIAVDQAGTKIYWTTSNLSTGSTVRSSNIDGTNEQTLYSFHPRAGRTCAASASVARHCSGRIMVTGASRRATLPEALHPYRW